MAKSRKSKSLADAAPRVLPVADVPCLRIVVGGKRGATGQRDDKACHVVGEPRGGAGDFDLAKKFGATSKTVAPFTNKPCTAPMTRKRKSCPVQLAFDHGQPFLRFCTAEKAKGYRLDVDTPAEAMAVSERVCAAWRQTGKFALPPETPLGGRKRRR